MEEPINRTCGSVRSSLSAPAQLVTVVSEAAVTIELRPSGVSSPYRTSTRLESTPGLRRLPRHQNGRSGQFANSGPGAGVAANDRGRQRTEQLLSRFTIALFFRRFYGAAIFL